MTSEFFFPYVIFCSVQDKENGALNDIIETILFKQQTFSRPTMAASRDKPLRRQVNGTSRTSHFDLHNSVLDETGWQWMAIENCVPFTPQ